MKHIVSGLLGGTVLAWGVYWILRNGGADDSGFFTTVLVVSTVVALLASPDRNIRLGLKRLWLLDWIPVVLAPMIILSFGPGEAIVMTGARYICFFAFFLAGATSARRYIAGRS